MARLTSVMPTRLALLTSVMRPISHIFITIFCTCFAFSTGESCMEINKGLQARTLSYFSVLQCAAKKLVECGVTTLHHNAITVLLKKRSGLKFFEKQ